MSLIGCAMWQTNSQCMSSDLEDELQQISEEMTSMQKQGTTLGQCLSQYSSEKDRAYNFIQNMQYKNIFGEQNPQAQQNFQASQQYIAEAEACFQDMEMRIQSINSQKDILGAEEKNLTSRKNSLENRKKLADQDSQSAASLKDKAIERYKINV